MERYVVFALVKETTLLTLRPEFQGDTWDEVVTFINNNSLERATVLDRDLDEIYQLPATWGVGSWPLMQP